MGVVGFVLLSSTWATALIPSLWGILVYSAPTSMDTKMESLGTLFTVLIFAKMPQYLLRKREVFPPMVGDDIL